MELSAQDREHISQAIRLAETKTSGEIVCVLARSSAGTPALPILIASVLALALPWLLVATTALTVYRILSLQIFLFVALLLILMLPRVRVALLPRRTRRAVAYRVASGQFVARGIARKKDRSGVLIFVSLAERYARIIADEGIASRVPQAEWQSAIDALISHMREGRIADGFITAIERCAAVLAVHFPPTTDGRDDLPDRIYVI
jgi:putative membrane protein